MEIAADDWKELWELVREAQRENATQNANIQNLCSRLEIQAEVTDRYFEAMDKRDAESARRFDTLMQAHKEHEANFWKIISVLIGAVLTLAVGPKAVDKLAEALGGSDPKATHVVTVTPYYDPKNYVVYCGGHT